jgi:hypothetical protein
MNIPSMKDAVLTDIRNYAIERLNRAYGFCGAACSEVSAHLSSNDGHGQDIKISITVAPE